jgi:glycine cleavage system H protein
MTIPVELSYTDSHEWGKFEDNVLVVGITDFGQDALGDIVSVETPKIGAIVAAGHHVAVVESLKAASDVLAPISGEIIAINEVVRDEPTTLNAAPYESWIFKIRPAANADCARLVDAAAYAALIGA